MLVTLNTSNVQQLKIDLRNHGKAFNKLKQDLARYSRQTSNDALSKRLMQNAEEISLQTIQYKEMFDMLVPILNKTLLEHKQHEQK